MHFKSIVHKTLVVAAMMAATWGAHASPIAHYNFDGGTAVNVATPGTYNLDSVGSPNFAGGSFLSDGTANNYLQVAGPGGQSDFTVSLWAYTEVANQGAFKALFSNNSSSTANFSWQIDSTDGDFVFRSAVSGPAISLGSVTPGEWNHIMLQKFGGNNARLYLNGSFISNIGFNPGGLQNFRVGINRNSNRAFEGILDNIRIYDDSTQEVATLFREGPGVNAVPVPTPAPLLLLAAGLLGMAALRRRHA